MISQGARELNIALLLDESDVEAAVRTLHAEFFE
jgi:aspartokinase